MNDEEKWFELLDATREAHKRVHASPVLAQCRLCRILTLFPEVPTIFTQLPELPAPAANALGGFRAADPDTSRKAAIFNYPRSGSQRHRILRQIAIAPVSGLTTSELEPITGLAHQSASTRISELARGGWIENAGRTRKSPLGAEQIVWVVTEKGLAAVREEDTSQAA